jgi:hypothetical protein
LASHPKLPEQSFSRKCPALRLGLTELESVEIGTTIVCAMKTVIVIAIVCGVEIGNRMKTTAVRLKPIWPRATYCDLDMFWQF